MKSNTQEFGSSLDLKILSFALLEEYRRKINAGIEERFNKLEDAEISTPDFSFYTSVASVFSSKIEGENIELDSYVKHKRFGVSFSPDYTKKTDDLYEAYIFAQENDLNKENIEKAHKILSKHFLAAHLQGKMRKQNMYVTTSSGEIEYVAALPSEVETEMQKLYADIFVLLNAELTIQEVFFFASFLHLVFVKIHPFSDGNGRTGRLLEKWFLARKLGSKSWLVQSEKYYYNHHQIYYNNLRALGLGYVALDYSKVLPFLLMSAESLEDF